MTKHFSSSEASFGPRGLLALVQHPLGVAVFQEPCLIPILGFSRETDVSDGNYCALWKWQSCSFIHHKPPVVRGILSCLTFSVFLKVVRSCFKLQKSGACRLKNDLLVAPLFLILGCYRGKRLEALVNDYFWNQRNILGYSGVAYVLIALYSLQSICHWHASILQRN